MRRRLGVQFSLAGIQKLKGKKHMRKMWMIVLIGLISVGLSACSTPPGLAKKGGVPPGLAKKGGIPPGQAKKIDNDTTIVIKT